MRRGQQTHRIRTKALQNKEIKSIKVFYLILNQNTIRGMKKKHKEKHRTKAQGKTQNKSTRKNTEQKHKEKYTYRVMVT